MSEKCFGLHGARKCDVRVEKNCVGYDNCPFYKSRSQQQEDQAKAYERLNSLSAQMQQYISEKYYGGLMPWIGECV